MMANRRKTDSEGWRFSKVISFDAIIQIVGIAIVLGMPLLYWGRSLESRVLTLENFNAAAAAADIRREADTRETRILFSGRLDKFSVDIEQLKIGVAQILARQGVNQGPPPSQRR